MDDLIGAGVGCLIAVVVIAIGALVLFTWLGGSFR